MKKIINILLLAFLFSTPFISRAETNLLIFEPTQFNIMQKDLGKETKILITNSTKQKLDFSVSEVGVIRENGRLVPTDNVLKLSKIDIITKTFSIEPGAKYELKARVKLNAKAEDGLYPALKIKTENTDVQAQLGIAQEFYIPYIIQNYEGEYKLNNQIFIGNSSILVNPEINMSGTIQNTGSKYFKPSGTIIISKNNVKLYEQEITTQIEGYLFPGEQKSYSIKWIIPKNDSIDSMGEYNIEVRIASDISETTNVSKATINYIPILLIAIVLGGTFGIAVLVLILKKIIIKKTKRSM